MLKSVLDASLISTANDGTFLYWCEISFPTGGCDIARSDSAEIIVNPDPLISLNPLTIDTICEGTLLDNPLFITYDTTTGVGDDFYQWYYSTDSSYTGTIITTGIYDTLTPLTDTLSIGSHYFYVILI